MSYQTQLRELLDVTPAGVETIDVYYSGGNDEGGVSDITFLDTDGKPVDVARDADVYDLAERLADMILDAEYGGFGFEGYVHGHIYVSVRERRLWMEGEQQQYVTADFSQWDVKA